MNAETQRRLHNIATIGTVSELDPANATMRLRVGELHTDWLPIPSVGAGSLSVWRCPSIGEQFLLIAPSGELACAIPVISLYSSHFGAPSHDPDELFIRFNGEDTLAVHATAHTLRLSMPNNTIKGNVVIDGDLSVTGSIHADGEIHSDTDVTAKVSLNTHTHGNVQNGRGTTGVPQ